MSNLQIKHAIKQAYLESSLTLNEDTLNEFIEVLVPKIQKIYGTEQWLKNKVQNLHKELTLEISDKDTTPQRRKYLQSAVEVLNFILSFDK